VSFFKSAKTEILSFTDNLTNPSIISKSASIQKIASFYNDNPPVAEDIASKLESVAESYSISTNPKDYVYVAVRALTADLPNENFDAFSEKELLRFEPKFGCKVYQTFKMKPHHVNHRSADPKQARGVILDAHYNTKNEKHFPEILIAVDKTKDKKLAEGIVSGDIPGFSMGCTADWTICAVCDHKASSPADFCNHIRFHKGKEINSKVAFEWCEGVCFEEESSVDDPADKEALTQEVILASKGLSKDLQMETEFLALNTKVNQLNAGLNKVIDKLDGKSTPLLKAASNSKKANPLMVAPEQEEESDVEKKKTKNFEKYTKDKKEEDEKQMSGTEYGVIPDMETERGRGVENTAKKSEGIKMAKNPYLKQALDSAGKEYWSKYLADYGKDITKDVKKKKLSSETKKADSGQMWKGTAKGGGNPPAEFKIDRKPGNPPAEFKFAGLYKDVEIYPSKKSYLLVAKSKCPIYLISCKDEKVNLKHAASDILKSVITVGLASTMKKFEAIQLKSYTPTFKPSLVEEFSSDVRDKSLRTKPTEGVNEDGVVDKGKPFMKGKFREDSVDADGVNTVKLSSAEMNRRITAMQDLMQMIDDEQSKGTAQEEIVKMIDTWIENWDKSGRPAITPGSGTSVVPGASPGTTSATPAGPMARVQKKKAKEAGSQDRALSDLANQDRFKKEESAPVTADGTDDLAKIQRDTTKADEIWSAGKDDLNITRKQVVDLKAEKENPYSKASSRPRISYETKETAVNEKNWKEVSDKKWKAIQKAEVERIQKESSKQVQEFKTAFRQRLVRALKLASMRSDLNLIESPLKMHLADVLIEENGDYTGMDTELATNLIENAFASTGSAHIEYLLKEAESYIDMPEESFLAIEEDTKKLNLVLPVADVTDRPGGEFPMSLGEGEEGFLDESEPGLDLGMEEEEIGSPAEELATKASKSNPVFTPHDSSTVGRFSELKGIFRNRFK
jgi:hypothetical protein